MLTPSFAITACIGMLSALAWRAQNPHISLGLWGSLISGSGGSLLAFYIAQGLTEINANPLTPFLWPDILALSLSAFLGGSGLNATCGMLRAGIKQAAETAHQARQHGTNDNPNAPAHHP